MSKRWTILLVLMLFAPRVWSAPVRLQKLVVTPAGEGVQAELVVSDSTRVRHFYLNGESTRLVVDFYNTVHALKAWNHPQFAGGLLRGVRSSQFSPLPEARARVVFDLARSSEFEVLTSGARTTVRLGPVGASVAEPIPPDPPEALVPPEAPHRFVARLRGASPAALAAALEKLGLSFVAAPEPRPLHGNVETDDERAFRRGLRKLIEEN